jgi:hypothetical protein
MLSQICQRTSPAENFKDLDSLSTLEGVRNKGRSEQWAFRLEVSDLFFSYAFRPLALLECGQFGSDVSKGLMECSG